MWWLAYQSSSHAFYQHVHSNSSSYRKVQMVVLWKTSLCRHWNIFFTFVMCDKCFFLICFLYKTNVMVKILLFKMDLATMTSDTGFLSSLLQPECHSFLVTSLYLTISALLEHPRHHQLSRWLHYLLNTPPTNPTIWAGSNCLKPAKPHHMEKVVMSSSYNQ